MRALLIVLGAVTLLTGPVAFLAPTYFYDAVPGLKLMGPFNLHFIRDVGLAFFASGGAILYGALNDNRAVAIAGAAWPFLHALFHVQIQIGRGLPFDTIMLFDLFAVILPAFLIMGLAWRLHRLA